jgi:PAS domain S-box-containing protein
MNLATMRKLVLGYLVAVPFLILITILQFMSVQGVTDAFRAEGEAFDVIRQGENLSATLTEAACSFGAYARTRRYEDQVIFEAARSRSKEITSRLIALTKRDAGQQARATRLDSLVSDRFELYREMLEPQAAAPSGVAAQKVSPVPMELEAQGAAKSAEIAKTLAELRHQEFDRLPALAADSAGRLQRANRMGPVAGVIAIWMVLLAALLLYRDTTRRAFTGLERRIQSRIVESLPLGVCLVDEMGLILYTNSAQDNLFGYEPGGMIGHHVSSLRNPSRGEDIDVFERANEELNLTGAWRGNFTGRQKNTSTVNCVAQAVKIDLSGKPHRLFLMASGGNPAPGES